MITTLDRYRFSEVIGDVFPSVSQLTFLEPAVDDEDTNTEYAARVIERTFYKFVAYDRAGNPLLVRVLHAWGLPSSRIVLRPKS